MSSRKSTPVALLATLAACTICAFGEGPDIQVVQVPVVTANIQFLRLPWPSTRFVARKMIQDNQGFLWFAAADGVRRYDAYGFMRVPEDPKTIGFIISESLMKDRSGRIWFGIEDSLGRYDPSIGKFQQYRPHPGDACGNLALAHQISEAQDGIMWLATDEGITSLDPVTSKASCYHPRYNDDPALGEKRIISTLASRDGTLWITSSAGLDVFDRRAGIVTRHFQLETSSGRKFRCTGFPATPFQDSTGMIWVGLSSGGDLASVNPQNGEITVYSFEGAGLPPNASSGVVSIQEDQDRALWLATNRLGLVKLTPDRKQAIWYESNPDDPNGLGRDLVVQLFRDREDSFWATTKAGDVYRFEPHAPVFRSYRHEPGNPRSLNDDWVTSAYAEDTDILYIGSELGLSRVNRKTGEVTRYDQPVFSRGVRAIVKDRMGDLWFGTRGNGLVRFNPHSGRYKIYSHVASDPRTLSYDTVGALWIDRGGTLWVATDFGLDRFDARTEEFRKYRPQDRTLTQYHSVAEEASGVLWLATSSHGLHRFDPSTGKFTIFENRPRDPNSIGHDRVNSVYADHSGTLWAATFRGLDKVNPRDGTFKSYDSRSGLPSNTALGILEDENGYLWVSTPDGLSRFDPHTETCINYHTSDGLLTDLFSAPVVATKSSSGEIFLGTYSGLVTFFPNQAIEHKFVAPVVLTNFRLSGQQAPIGKGPLKQPIWSTTSLELSARSILSFDFSALSYTDPARTQYRYRLEELEPAWNEADSTRRTVTYTTLPSGNYTLRVQARTTRGDWSETGVALPIRIKPPWYGTWLFRALCAAVFLTIVWASHRHRVRHLQHEFKKLRDVIDTIPAMAWTALPDGSNAFVNRRWAEYTGLSPEDTAGAGWTAALHPEDREAYSARWKAALAAGVPFEAEARIRCAATGEYRSLLARGVPLRDERGKIVRWYGVLTDIEDHKRAEQERERLQADLAHINRISTMGELSASIAHEV
ncbi:MAG TPA: two-component regulator propeller domain-containing protein, partial [Terriglobales bacterium]|nr:two-component regulator propeller domain-containing protein [Terriglobales bacterium]